VQNVDFYMTRSRSNERRHLREFDINNNNNNTNNNNNNKPAKVEAT
jgi:hypothetical protein